MDALSRTTTLFRVSRRVGWVVVGLGVPTVIASLLALRIIGVEAESELPLDLVVLAVYGTGMTVFLGTAYLLIDRRRAPPLAVVLLLLAAVPLYMWLIGLFYLFRVATTAPGQSPAVVVDAIDWFGFRLALYSLLILTIAVPVVALLPDRTRRAFYDARQPRSSDAGSTAAMSASSPSP
jgi:hypothetical protein